MIDCHCHILPGIDDGAKDIEMSLAMARKAITSGTTDILATPHNMNGVFDNNKTEILAATSDLQSHLDRLKLPLNVHPGSECHLVPELIDQIKLGNVMTYANQGKALLVELPKHMIPMGADSILTNILYLGITPVIAHPERNTALRKDWKRLEQWINLGCRTQVTAQSCSGEFGRELEKVCKAWCLQGWVHIVASDAHRPIGRSPDMSKGISNVQKWLNKEASDIIVKRNPLHLLNGEPLESPPAGKATKGWFNLGFFRSS